MNIPIAFLEQSYWDNMNCNSNEDYFYTFISIIDIKLPYIVEKIIKINLGYLKKWKN